LAIGYWLLAIGYWLLAIGYWQNKKSKTLKLLKLSETDNHPQKTKNK
jgi:hypothetical protein